MNNSERKKANRILDAEAAKKRAGIYEKFRVERTNGSSAVGGKHHGCHYFVLDLSCDKHAIPALAAYAASCQNDFPFLARDLLATAFKAMEHGMISLNNEVPMRYPVEPLTQKGQP